MVFLPPAVFRRFLPFCHLRVLLVPVFRRLSIPCDLLRDSVHRHEPVTLAFVRDIAHFSRYFLLNIRALQYLFIRLDQQQFPFSTSLKIDPLRFEELVVWTIRLRESFR